MKSSVKLALFDLGSTLIFEKDDWSPFFPRADAALWKVLHEAGVHLKPHDLYGDFDTLFHLYYVQHRNDLDEPTTAVVLDGLLQSKGYSLPDATLRAAMRAMYAVTQSNWFTEEDAIPTLELLRKRSLHIGLISNAADDENTHTLIDKGGFRPFLEFIISSAAFGKRKPHPDIFRAALDHFQVTPDSAVMIGDTFEADILGADSLGMNTIWITRRVQNPLNPISIQPDAIVGTLREIPAILSGQ
jgi:HAD superfamily hydrolase (TIGR01509 family)